MLWRLSDWQEHEYTVALPIHVMTYQSIHSFKFCVYVCEVYVETRRMCHIRVCQCGCELPDLGAGNQSQVL